MAGYVLFALLLAAALSLDGGGVIERVIILFGYLLLLAAPVISVLCLRSRWFAPLVFAFWFLVAGGHGVAASALHRYERYAVIYDRAAEHDVSTSGEERFERISGKLEVDHVLMYPRLDLELRAPLPIVGDRVHAHLRFWSFWKALFIAVIWLAIPRRWLPAQRGTLAQAASPSN